MYQAAFGLHAVAATVATLGVVAIGFGLVIRPMAEETSTSLIRAGLYVAGSALLIYFVT